MASTPRCYDYVQTFYIDSKAVKKSPTVQIDKIKLFFKSKPRKGGQNNQNKTGIKKPGVKIIICGTGEKGRPLLSERYGKARLEYDEIVVSNDASNPTVVKFDKPIILETDQNYGIAILADGNEDFEMWTNKKGDKKVGTNKISEGTTDQNVRKLFVMLDRDGLTNDKNDSDDASWVPLTDEDLKFKIFVCRFNDGASQDNKASKIEVLDTAALEFVLYDRTLSTKESKVRLGDIVYQNTSFHSGTVNVKKGSLSLKGTGVDFETLYGADSNAHIVIVSESSANAYRQGIDDDYTINIRKVVSVTANDTIVIDKLPTFTNASAKFLMPTAVGEVTFNSISQNFTKRQNIDSWYFPDRARLDMLILADSNANSSVKFVNNAIEEITIVNGGTGYSNTDILTVYSSTSGSLNCVANVVTNSSGGIIDFNISNNGWGMVSSPLYIISNSTVLTSNTSAGSSANLTFIEGPTLRSELERFKLRDINIINYQIDALEPVLPVSNSKEKEYKHRWHHAFYNDSSGDIQQLAVADVYKISNLTRTFIPFKKDPVILSKSNLLSGISNGTFGNSQFALSNGATINSVSSVLIESAGEASSDFVCTAVLDQPDAIYYSYTINNDYTGENTPFGNATAKYVSKKISFAEGRLAEDVMVYIRAYRPVGTDVKVFARIHNSQDAEAFDDKDWTLLDCISGEKSYSIKDNKNDLIEYTYTFNQYPNSQFTSPGVVSISNTTTKNVTGTDTSFTSQVQGFSNGDLVKIYSPIFPNNYFITVVTDVTNSTHMSIANNTSNSSLTGSGLYIDKLAYPHQAFRDIRFQNVATYFSTSMQSFSGYDTVAVKLVLLSPTSSNVPEIDDVRVVGVSA